LETERPESLDSRMALSNNLADTCCNPKHLFPTLPGGEELTAKEASTVIESGTTTLDKVRDPSKKSVRLVLDDDLDSVAALCRVDDSGCWIAPTAGPVPCRPHGDDRDYRALPIMAPHRWTWMVAHGRSKKLLPGNMFQVRRRCGKDKCCNPEHLYLTAPDGEELSLDEAETWLRSGKARWQDALGWTTRQICLVSTLGTRGLPCLAMIGSRGFTMVSLPRRVLVNRGRCPRAILVLVSAFMAEAM
jgi:hypothetical protein